MSTIFEAVSDKEMMSFGYFGSSSLEKARAALLEDGVDAPEDLQLVAREALVANDWELLEAVTVSGRYLAYSPSLDREASVFVRVGSRGCRIDNKRLAVAVA